MAQPIRPPAPWPIAEPTVAGSLYDLIVKTALAVRTLAIDLDDHTFLVPAQLRLLGRIRTDGTSTVNQLARDVGVTPASASRMLSRFQKYDWIERPGPRRRGRPVVLTRWGEIVRRGASAEHIDEEITRDMSAHDVAELRRLLELVLRTRRRVPRYERPYLG